jgi:phenylacetate-coenzyme A ligase PaaK-like adenylate-forming protein
VARGSGQAPNDRTVKADLIDISAKTTVTTGRVTTTRRTRGDIEQAADRARAGAVPDGFGRQLRITAGPGSALYWSSAADVAAGLRAAGVTPTMLHGIRRIRVVTGFGTATLTPNQLRK